MQTQPSNQGIDWIRFSLDTSNSLARLEKGCEDFEKACKERHNNLDNRFDNVNNQISRLDDKISKAVPNWLLTILISIATGIASALGTLLFQ